MWMNCHGAMAHPENQVSTSSTFGDNGTASHEFAAECLQAGYNAEKLIGESVELNGAKYIMDEDRAVFVQNYVDDVRRRAMGGKLFVEYHVDLSDLLGPEQGGTADAGIIQHKARELIVEDLKYGIGEKVEASYVNAEGVRQINEQGGLYLRGLLSDALLLGYDIDKVTFVVHQPRLGHVDEYAISVVELEAFAQRAKNAMELNTEASILSLDDPKFQDYLHPGDKTCRWCNVKATCAKLAKHVGDATRLDFDNLSDVEAPGPTNTEALSKAFIAAPLVSMWLKAVLANTHAAVANGLDVLGVDGQPLKFVEGKMGSRRWSNPDEAEAALVGQLADKAYEPRKIITAPIAAKLLDKKATKATWNDVFLPMISKGAAKPTLVLGSDPRPKCEGATAAEFDEITDIES